MGIGADFHAQYAELLTEAPLKVYGRLADSSNNALVVIAGSGAADSDGVVAVYKPVAGERPLWDFPDDTLARREVATYELSRLLGWHLVPVTVWRDNGPAGPGMCQVWVESGDVGGYVSVFPIDSAPPDWHRIIDGAAEDGTPVVVAHSDADQLRRMAAFDALCNNADRKIGHLLMDGDELVGIDHGVTFNTEPKLRTVLWGFRGQPLGPEVVDAFSALAADFDAAAIGLAPYLSAADLTALRLRLDALLGSSVYPQPSGEMPAIPSGLSSDASTSAISTVTGMIRSRGVFRTKSVEQSIAETDEPGHKLKKNLTAIDLTVFGVGVTIGAGIFILTGRVAATNSGPAVALSFLLAAFACGLAAMCYAEFASTVPVAGSAYTFSYATFGELVAWIIGWDLMLEFVIGASAVASGWSGYFETLFAGTAIELPSDWVNAPPDGIVNLPAGLLCLVLTVVLIAGVKLSSRINQIVVAIKVAIVLFVIVAGIGYINTANWNPFIPPAEPASAADATFLSAPLIETIFGLTPAVFGVGGVIAGAAIVFFAFIGFDVVATTAEETKNPQRDTPRGIIGALVICAVLYASVSMVVTGMQNYKDIDPNDAAPLASAFTAVGKPGFATIISVGAVIGLIVVVMILLLGQSRVMFAMGRDGLLPSGLAKVHPKYGTPYIITAIVGGAVSLIAAFLPISELAELVNVGTLFAFILVSFGVVVLRRSRPDLKRAFRVPLSPVIPIVSGLLSFYLMLNLSGETWVRFFVWMIIGIIVYLAYGKSHSRLAIKRGEVPADKEA